MFVDTLAFLYFKNMPSLGQQHIFELSLYLQHYESKKKSSCVRIGHRHNVTCASITTCQGQPLHWVSEFRYLGHSLFHRRFSNVHLHMLNVLSVPR